MYQQPLQQLTPKQHNKQIYPQQSNILNNLLFNNNNHIQYNTFDIYADKDGIEIDVSQYNNSWGNYRQDQKGMEYKYGQYSCGGDNKYIGQQQRYRIQQNSITNQQKYCQNNSAVYLPNQQPKPQPLSILSQKLQIQKQITSNKQYKIQQIYHNKTIQKTNNNIIKTKNKQKQLQNQQNNKQYYNQNIIEEYNRKDMIKLGKINKLLYIMDKYKDITSQTNKQYIKSNKDKQQTIKYTQIKNNTLQQYTNILQQISTINTNNKNNNIPHTFIKLYKKQQTPYKNKDKHKLNSSKNNKQQIKQYTITSNNKQKQLHPVSMLLFIGFVLVILWIYV